MIYSSEVPCDSPDFPWVYEEMDVGGDPQPIIRFERSSLPPTGAKISVEYNISYAEQDLFVEVSDAFILDDWSIGFCTPSAEEAKVSSGFDLCKFFRLFGSCELCVEQSCQM